MAKRSCPVSALLLVAGALVLAACGSTSGSPTSSQQAESSGPAAASVVVTVPPAATASPPASTIAPTPTPTAMPSPTPAGAFNSATFLADLKAGGAALAVYRKPKISLSQLKQAFDALMASDAKPSNQYFAIMFADCVDLKSGRDTLITECMSTTGWALRAIHEHRTSAEAEAFGLAIARWDLGWVYTTADTVAFLKQGVVNAIANF